MNGDDLEFKKGLVRLQKMQNEYVMQREREETSCLREVSRNSSQR